MSETLLRTMPHDSEAEAVVLSACIANPTESLDDAMGELGDSHFYHRANRIIFAGLKEMRLKGQPIESRSLILHFKEKGQLEEIGGMESIFKLCGSFPPDSHFKFYMEALHQKFQLRGMAEIGNDMMAAAFANESPQDIAKILDSRMFQICKTGGQQGRNCLGSAADKLQAMIDKRKSGEKATGTLSGVPTFDKIYHGFQPTQYYVIAGRPSSGKSALADQITVNLVMGDMPVLYIPLESSDERVMGKMACKVAGISFGDFLKNDISLSDLKQIEEATNILRKKPLFLVRPREITTAEIRAIFMRHARQHQLALFVLDYIQKIPTPKGYDERRTISEASMAIQQCSIETGVPSLILAQLNRESEKAARPKMSHLKESSQIEQDADNILILWTEQDPHEIPQGQLLPVIMSIEKNKDGVSGVDEHVLFDRPKMMFREQARQSEARQPHNNE